MIEEWRDVLGYEGVYQVSSLGRVRSLDRNSPFMRHGKLISRTLSGKILQPVRDAKGYCRVTLSKSNAKNYKVHRLVLEAFVGLKPDGFNACHNNGNQLDNRASNLRWDTPLANHKDKVKHGTSPVGERHWSSKLKEDDVLRIRAQVNAGATQYAIAKERGLSSSLVNQIILRKIWRHI